MSRGRVLATLVAGVGLAGCSSAGKPAPATAVRASQPPVAGSASAATSKPATPTPAPLPAYAIDSLRLRPRASGVLSVGPLLGRGAGYDRYAARWPSMGSRMTG